jgi:transcription elongation GreA/GreB family factor
VTPDGLDHLDKMIAKAEQDHTEALASDDVNELARTERDRRYWSTRRATAQVAEQKRSGTTVEFGSTVRISRDGEEQTYRIVGADEADPADGALSHNAPLARALLGKSKGDEIAVGGTRLSGLSSNPLTRIATPRVGTLSQDSLRVILVVFAPGTSHSSGR